MVWNQQKIFFSGILNISQIIQMQVPPKEPSHRDIPTIKKLTNSTNFTFRRTLQGIHEGRLSEKMITMESALSVKKIH